jgi:hypothetical protein
MPRTSLLVVLVVLLLVAGSVAAATAQSIPMDGRATDAPLAPLGTAFTYQGRLTVSGSPADGLFDFEFRLFDALTAGNPVGSAVVVQDVAVSNGLFVVQLDFGDVFLGEAAFLQIGVRPGASAGAFTALSPRQELTPTPYALHAASALSATNALTATNALHAADAWSINGNAATDPAANFLGTTDNVALELRANNLAALRIEPKTDVLFGDAPNMIGGYSGNVVIGTVLGATIAGGGALQDDASSDSAHNEVSGHFGVVGGGTANLAGQWAVVDGGMENRAAGQFSTVGGGSDNTASGQGSVVPGGEYGTAQGASSFAAGFGASALHAGAFVWGDANVAGQSTLKVVESTEANQFLVRATGGAIFLNRTNYPASPAGPIGVEAMQPLFTNAALQVENGRNNGEGGWLYTSAVTNTASVLKLLKVPTGTNFFLECENFAVARKCHIDANGTFVAGSDFAEALPVAGDHAGYEAGDVLILSDERPGGVEKAAQPYDTRVAGVYSTRPGVLGADKDGNTWIAADEIPVGIVGIVPTKVTAENGPIAVGDLLTTSSTAGHAMKAEALVIQGHTIYPPGTILGKAMEPLASGTGVIRVLVTLQ